MLSADSRRMTIVRNKGIKQESERQPNRELWELDDQLNIINKCETWIYM